ncbi:MAG: FAD:protein FMN transferase [Pseudomonadota bacterium]
MMVRRYSRRKIIGHVGGLALATPLLSLAACGDKPSDDLVSLSGSTMGTSYTVKVLSRATDQDLHAVGNEIDGALTGVDRRMSTYRSDSELSLFNVAGRDVEVPLSGDTLAVIEEAGRLNLLTEGSFDPTIGPIVDLWGFGPEENRQQVPLAQKISDLRPKVGFDKIAINSAAPSLSKKSEGVRLDLSGIAKGYGVDLVASVLDARGIDQYLIEVGGELRSRGLGPGDRPWRVGIEKPIAGAQDLQQIVELENAAMATSGNYRLFFEQQGQNYSHIIDPGSGRPVEHSLASVTVVAETTMQADALSTALLVMGPKKAMKLAANHNIAAFFITGSQGSFAESPSPAFEARYLA